MHSTPAFPAASPWAATLRSVFHRDLSKDLTPQYESSPLKSSIRANLFPLRHLPASLYTSRKSRYCGLELKGSLCGSKERAGGVGVHNQIFRTPLPTHKANSPFKLAFKSFWQSFVVEHKACNRRLPPQGTRVERDLYRISSLFFAESLVHLPTAKTLDLSDFSKRMVIIDEMCNTGLFHPPLTSMAASRCY